MPTSTITWHCFRRSTHITKQLAAYEQAQADAGLAPSDDTIDRILKSCKSYLIRPENSLLTETFASRLNAVEGLSDAEKASYKAKHLTILKEHFIPAYTNLSKALESPQGLPSGGRRT